MYVVNLMNVHRTRQEYAEFHQVLHSALLLYLTITVAASAVVLSIAWQVPWVNLLKLEVIGQEMAAVLFILISVSILASLLAGLLSGIYRCIGEYDRGQNVGNAVRLINLVATFAALLADGGPIIVVGLMALQPFLALGIVIHDLRRRHRDIEIGLSKASWRQARTFFGPGMLFFLFPLSNSLTVQGTSIVLSATLGSTSLVLFTTTRTLANLLRQLFSAMNTALWPEVTSLYAAGDFGRLRLLHSKACKYAFAGSFAVATFLFFFGPSIYKEWTRHRVEPDMVLFGIFLVVAVSESLWFTSGTFQAAVNLHRNSAVRSLLAALTTISLALILVHFWKERGVGLAVLVAELLFLSYGLMRNTCRIIEESAASLLVNILLRSAPFAICSVLLSWGLSVAVKEHWSGLLLAGVLYGLSVAMTAKIFLLDDIEKKRVRSWMTTWSEVL